MIEILYSVVFFIVAIGVLISFHEFGHFWVARRLGVAVLRFSIGFGPALYRYVSSKSETEYVLAAIPLGGYVKMLDESRDEVPAEKASKAFNRQPLYKRSAIVAAGPLANFLLAAILYGAAFAVGTVGIKPFVGEVVEGSIAEQAGFVVGDEIVLIDGRVNQSWRQHHFHVLDKIVNQDALEYEVVSENGFRKSITVDFSEIGDVDVQSVPIERILGMYSKIPLIQAIIGDVVDGYPAQAAGLQSGDRILTAHGVQIDDWDSLVSVIQRSAGIAVPITFERNENIQEITLIPNVVDSNGERIGQIGITVDVQQQIRDSDAAVMVRLGPLDAMWRGIQSTWSITRLTVKFLVDMLKFEKPADTIGGPIAIAEYAGKSAQAGVYNYLTFLALLSVSLGILNLLPIPVLDGGHLMFHVYEAVTGSPPPEKMLMWANQVGLALLIGLMGLAFYNDLSRIF